MSVLLWVTVDFIVIITKFQAQRTELIIFSLHVALLYHHGSANFIYYLANLCCLGLFISLSVLYFICTNEDNNSFNLLGCTED